MMIRLHPELNLISMEFNFSGRARAIIDLDPGDDIKSALDKSIEENACSATGDSYVSSTERTDSFPDKFFPFIPNYFFLSDEHKMHQGNTIVRIVDTKHWSRSLLRCSVIDDPSSFFACYPMNLIPIFFGTLFEISEDNSDDPDHRLVYFKNTFSTNPLRLHCFTLKNGLIQDRNILVTEIKRVVNLLPQIHPVLIPSTNRMDRYEIGTLWDQKHVFARNLYSSKIPPCIFLRHGAKFRPVNGTTLFNLTSRHHKIANRDCMLEFLFVIDYNLGIQDVVARVLTEENKIDLKSGELVRMSSFQIESLVY